MDNQLEKLLLLIRCLGNEMSFLIFKYNDGYYEEDKSDDSYLTMLSEVFDEGSYWTNAIRHALQNPISEGATGNKTDVTIKGDKVIIEPLFAENPQEYAIEIDRQVLFDLINKWQELVAKKCQEITFTRHEDGSITLSGK